MAVFRLVLLVLKVDEVWFFVVVLVVYSDLHSLLVLWMVGDSPLWDWADLILDGSKILVLDENPVC